MSMFSSFFNKKETSPIPASHSHSNHQPQQKPHEEDDVVDDDSDTKISNLDLTVEMGGGKGWTIEATCILYHRIQVENLISLFRFIVNIMFSDRVSYA
jgi:hypothetical protein